MGLALEEFIKNNPSTKPRQIGFIGIYEEESLKTHCVKILATDIEDAIYKFTEYLMKNILTVFREYQMTVIPLHSIEIIGLK